MAAKGQSDAKMLQNGRVSLTTEIYQLCRELANEYVTTDALYGKAKLEAQRLLRSTDVLSSTDARGRSLSSSEAEQVMEAVREHQRTKSRMAGITQSEVISSPTSGRRYIQLQTNTPRQTTVLLPEGSSHRTVRCVMGRLARGSPTKRSVSNERTTGQCESTTVVPFTKDVSNDARTVRLSTHRAAPLGSRPLY